MGQFLGGVASGMGGLASGIGGMFSGLGDIFGNMLQSKMGGQFPGQGQGQSSIPSSPFSVDPMQTMENQANIAPPTSPQRGTLGSMLTKNIAESMAPKAPEAPPIEGFSPKPMEPNMSIDTMRQKKLGAVQQAAQNPGDYMSIARGYLGKNEQQHAGVLKDFFQKSLGQSIDPKDTAWCAAFANAVLIAGGHEGTGSLMAKSFMNYGKEVDKPSKGDIAVFNRGNPNSPYGHVGFYVGEENVGGREYVDVLGGNQSDSVSVKRYPKAALLGYRRPEF